MNNDKITRLKTVPIGPAIDASPDALVDRLSTMLRENGILEEWDETDIDLDPPSSDEIRIGELNHLERSLFIIGRLTGQILSEEILEVQVTQTETMTKIMRAQKVPAEQAAAIIAQDPAKYLDPATSSQLMQIATSSAMATASFEWMIRSRFNVWPSYVIVRSGFVAYSYDG